MPQRHMEKHQVGQEAEGMRGKHRQKTSLWFLQKEMNRQGKQSRIDWFKSFQQALGCESGP